MPRVLNRIAILVLNTCICFLALGQETSRQTGFNLTGIPVLKFSSDEGFGYGIRLSLYNHSDGGYNPYYYLIDTQVSFTTGGKKEVFVFFDSPFIIGDAARLTGEIRYQDDDFSPFYGIGPASEFTEAFSEEGNPEFINEDYYRFGRKRITAWLDYQYRLGAIRLLGGFNIAHSDIGLLGDSTALALDGSVSGKNGGFTNYIKLGIVYDSRDFEPAPTRGDWIDLVLEWSGDLTASDYSYRRMTLTQRHYFPIFSSLVLAQRLAFVHTWGTIPFYETAFVASTFRIEEGVGGAKSVRGLLKNRYLGPVEGFGNLELRWRVTDIRLLGQNLSLTLAGFWDGGGAWNALDQLSLDSIHGGQGGGIHVGWDESFIITADAARSDEVNLALYIGVGYLF